MDKSYRIEVTKLTWKMSEVGGAKLCYNFQSRYCVLIVDHVACLTTLCLLSEPNTLGTLRRLPVWCGDKILNFKIPNDFLCVSTQGKNQRK